MRNQLSIFIYRITIQIYGLLIRLAALFNAKARLWVNGRKGIFKELTDAFKSENAPIIWMHCASLGEFEQGRPIIERLKKDYPNYKILLTFFSPAGYEIRKNYQNAAYIFYLPIDSPKNANQFIDIVQPEIVFFIKYEFWYFYLNALQERGIKHYLIAGVFRKNQFFFKKYARWYLKAIEGFTHLFLQDKTTQLIIEEAGLANYSVMGDPRIDQVLSIAQRPTAIPIILQFKTDRFLFIVGSAHLKDAEIFFEFLKLILKKDYFKNWCFLLAPHEVDERNIKQMEMASPLPFNRFSTASQQPIANNNSLLVLDTIGQLSSAYQYADAVFIGGGFDTGIHNILEPAVFGVPICFGSNFKKFQEAKALIAKGGAFSIVAAKELEEWFEQVNEVEKRKKMGSINKDYTAQNKGATNNIINYLNNKNVIKFK